MASATGLVTAPPRERQILVDVSVVAHNDARSGIQRVVRALYKGLQEEPPDGYQVRPVVATNRHSYSYAVEDFLNREGDARTRTGPLVTPQKGDLFFALDLALDAIPRHASILFNWKRQGVRFLILVHDLLPVRQPSWFTTEGSFRFLFWLRAVAVLADGFICVSSSTRNDLVDWLRTRYAIDKKSFAAAILRPGANLEASIPSRGLPVDCAMLLECIERRQFVLIVGTIEPRKGHAQALGAFELLWRAGSSLGLVIVGKPGWRVEPLTQRFDSHPENGERLLWLANASDELLDLLYRRAGGVLVTSEGEGFGLPLLEALKYNKPVLARRLPVFEEVAGDSVVYFSDQSASGLAQAIVGWVAQWSNWARPAPQITTWQESTGRLRALLAADLATWSDL